MEAIVQYHPIAGVTAARIFLGCLFFFQGYDAVFGIGLKKVADTYKEGFQRKRIPAFLISAVAVFTSCTELAGGFLLLPGLFEFPVLYLLALNLIIAAIGFGIQSPLWDMHHVWPRLVLVLLLLFVPLRWHAWSVDQLFNYLS